MNKLVFLLTTIILSLSSCVIKKNVSPIEGENVSSNEKQWIIAPGQYNITLAWEYWINGPNKDDPDAPHLMSKVLYKNTNGKWSTWVILKCASLEGITYSCHLRDMIWADSNNVYVATCTQDDEISFYLISKSNRIIKKKYSLLLECNSYISTHKLLSSGNFIIAMNCYEENRSKILIIMCKEGLTNKPEVIKKVNCESSQDIQKLRIKELDSKNILIIAVGTEGTISEEKIMLP